MKKQFFILILLLAGITITGYTQQKLDKFESAILEYEKQDQKNGHQPGAVLFTGSSSIRMWKSLADDMAPIPVLNRGFGGSTIPEVTYYADRILLPHQPKIIVFYCGENDLSNDEAKSDLALKSFKQFHTYMKKNLPETKVFFIAIKPSISRWHYWTKMSEANEKIEKFINRKDNYFFVDTASGMLDENGTVLQDIFIKDNLHMNEKGYDIWTKILKPILEKHYPD
jgi:lysophospholipase L1-like esterase